jgi:NRAMP (natural resistance-associated macrophage protein)-like metal ion transporter
MGKVASKIKLFWQRLGPGLVTGAADDDPSGVVAYSVAGAKFGLAMLWTALFTIPFMIIIQRMAGRIGLISGKGLAGNMKKHYPKWILICIAFLIVAAGIINIGADISGMSAAFTLMVPSVSPIIFAVIIAVSIVLSMIFFSYRHIAKYLKWVALVMLSYILAAFLVQHDWLQILYRTFIPQITFDKEHIMILAAVFGTTISPYLFFWQASEVVEEERMHQKPAPDAAHMIPSTEPHGTHRSKTIIKNEISSMYQDVGFGMIFSNVITFFIIILNAATLFKGGITNVSTVEEIASALRPLAGEYTNLLFLIGILAAGILAIPTLAGSAAYALSELFGWREGLDKKFKKAKQFYLVIIIATALGVLIPVLGLQPVQILVYTAVIYGAISPFLILLLIHMANNPKIMGTYTSRTYSNVIAYVLFLIMSASTILMFVL